MKGIDSAINYLDTFIEQRGWKEVFEAYQTLKAAVLAQQTTNKQSTPLQTCLVCGKTDTNYIAEGVCRACRR